MKKKKNKNPKTYAEWWSFKPICQIDLERPFHRTLALTKSPRSHLYPGQSANLTTSFQQPWVGICVQLLMEGSVLKPLLSPLPLKSICSVLFPHSTFIFGSITYEVLSITGPQTQSLQAKSSLPSDPVNKMLLDHIHWPLVQALSMDATTAEQLLQIWLGPQSLKYLPSGP